MNAPRKMYAPVLIQYAQIFVEVIVARIKTVHQIIPMIHYIKSNFADIRIIQEEFIYVSFTFQPLQANFVDM